MRFLHTSDWQLGMTRHFFDAGAQDRFAQARLDAIVRMAAIASERDCAFVVVAGDVFDTNQADRRTVARALDALRTFTVPVYLLPGNHDCYDPGSIYRNPVFTRHHPENVEVLVDTAPRVPVDGVEVVGAPMCSRAPLRDLVAEACAGLVADGRRRVLVGHGQVDALLGGVAETPATLRLADAEAAIAERRISYLALGDRHSTTEVGSSGGVWYSGAPEPTSYRETERGAALLVDIGGDTPVVERVEVGEWRFHVVEAEVNGAADVDALRRHLEAIPDRTRAVVKLKVTGTLGLREAAALDELIEAQGDVFGALEAPERHRDLAVRPADDDFGSVHLQGYAAAARDRLLERAAGQGSDAEAAADALGLLLRLAETP